MNYRNIFMYIMEKRNIISDLPESLRNQILMDFENWKEVKYAGQRHNEKQMAHVRQHHGEPPQCTCDKTNLGDVVNCEIHGAMTPDFYLECKIEKTFQQMIDEAQRYWYESKGVEFQDPTPTPMPFL